MLPSFKGGSFPTSAWRYQRLNLELSACKPCAGPLSYSLSLIQYSTLALWCYRTCTSALYLSIFPSCTWNRVMRLMICLKLFFFWGLLMLYYALSPKSSLNNLFGIYLHAISWFKNNESGQHNSTRQAAFLTIRRHISAGRLSPAKLYRHHLSKTVLSFEDLTSKSWTPTGHTRFWYTLQCCSANWVKRGTIICEKNASSVSSEGSISIKRAHLKNMSGSRLPSARLALEMKMPPVNQTMDPSGPAMSPLNDSTTLRA